MNTFELECCVRGYHAYRDIWAPSIGKKYMCQKNAFTGAIAVLHEGRVVGHVPRQISRPVSQFLENKRAEVYCQVIGEERTSLDQKGGQEIPCRYFFTGKMEDISFLELKIKGNQKKRSYYKRDACNSRKRSRGVPSNNKKSRHTKYTHANTQSTSDSDSDSVETVKEENDNGGSILKKPPDVMDVFNLLKENSNHWDDLSRELKISEDLRSSLRTSTVYNSTSQKLEQILQNWKDYEPSEVTWDMILKALEKLKLKGVAREVKEFLRQEKVRSKYMKKADFIVYEELK